MAFTDSHQIIVDRRPLWIVLVDRLRREIFLLLFFAVFAGLLNLEPPADLSPEGYKVLCVFFLCVGLWSTNLIPLSITSLLAMALIPLLGIMESSKVYAFFGNKAVFFILGVFILSAAMISCGLSARLSVWVMERWGRNPVMLMTSIYIFGAISSCFMSEHAVAAMMYPLVLEIVGALGLKQGKSVFGKGLFFALGWGCIIGGATTVLGGGRVPLAVEIMEKSTGGEATLGVLQYTGLGFPLVVLMFLSGWWVLTRWFAPEEIDIGPALQVLREKSRAMGKVSFQEKGIGAVLVVTIFFWFGYGHQLGIANIALVSIVLLFMLNLINWKMVEEHVNWAIILMYGGAICLGEVMASSGAALWLARKLFEDFIHSGPMFLLCLAVLSTVFTTFMSNSAVIAVLLPPAISLCAEYGVSVPMSALAIILPSNFAFMLPIATPASALAYSSRFITLGEMVKSGLILNLAGLLSFLVLLFIYWPLVGFR
ncbi:MAG: anion:sodium symporter [Nitrospinae bacterium CG11_big_fil_rev_8_21_14_0_20_56_8]|nr:MAG: anion:sodium symporter [Nitrospinae bacterium CG11_big_fil_rev_8_21_14_0_20_56_8]